MKNVVIPLEITEISSEILPVIRRVFDVNDSILTLLTVREPFKVSSAMVGTPLMDGMAAVTVIEQCEDEWRTRQQRAQDHLLGIAQTLREEGYRVSTAVLDGEVVPAIARYVNAHKFDVLAMATFGRTGLDRLLNGSIAESLLRLVTTPMLLIRHQASNEPMRGEEVPDDKTLAAALKASMLLPLAKPVAIPLPVPVNDMRRDQKRW